MSGSFYTRSYGAALQLFGSARFTSTLTQVAVGVAFSTHLLRSLIGWPGLLGALLTVVILAALAMLARWRTIEWHGLLPISIILFLGWSVLSLAWSDHTLLTLFGVGYQLLFAFLAIAIALMRDTIQIVRAVGDVLRLLLGLSLVLEVLSGVILDLPIVVLGIHGNIASLGPIQGVFGSRNALALVALIGVVTFIVEWRARSITRNRCAVSLVLALSCLALTGSPVVILVSAAVLLAAAALYLLRRTPAEHRWKLQLGLLGAVLVAGLTAWLFRTRIIDLLNAGSEFEVRYTLWQEMLRMVSVHPLEGWGWVGFWPNIVSPYGWLDFVTRKDNDSGLNAFLDVYLQLGLVGFLLFVALVALAFVRSWLLASDKRPVVYVWPALILVILVATSAAESTVLAEVGWMLVLICSVKAAQGMSWRTALARHPRKDLD